MAILAFAVARPLGLDVLAGPNLYPRAHDRLVRGYALDGASSRPQTLAA